jgi:hypothetical protein
MTLFWELCDKIGTGILDELQLIKEESHKDEKHPYIDLSVYK